MKVFNFVVIQKTDDKEVLIDVTGPTITNGRIIAKDESQALITIARNLPDNVNTEEVDIRIHPFS